MLLVIISAWYLSKLAMQPLYLSYRQIQQFTGDAAHELRTPLATIRATIESNLLAPVWQENQIKEILATIERQNQRMSNLVADLLTLTRLDRFGSTNLSQEQTSVIVLKDLIEDLIEELAYLALDSKIELITDIRANSWQIAGNESQIYRLLANILVNAIQYTPDNGKVTIILDKDTHHAIIKIKDTGIGIPEAEKSRIFERFYRVNGDRSRQTGGSGLGLAIALGIAHAHQGSIKVDSEMGNGSIFTIKLPKINLS
jgi:signal transduction histidine kinase